MKITLDVDTLCTRADYLRRALEGLRSVNDQGEELLAALEALVAAGPPAARLTDREVADEFRRQGGNVAHTARVLGISRGTVRYRLARVAAVAPMRRAANDG